jgi:hypothetical protein
MVFFILFQRCLLSIKICLFCSTKMSTTFSNSSCLRLILPIWFENHFTSMSTGVLSSFDSSLISYYYIWCSLLARRLIYLRAALCYPWDTCFHERIASAESIDMATAISLCGNRTCSVDVWKTHSYYVWSNVVISCLWNH